MMPIATMPNPMLLREAAPVAGTIGGEEGGVDDVDGNVDGVGGTFQAALDVEQSAFEGAR